MSHESLPPVALYAIGPQQAEQAAALLPEEAVTAIQRGEAFGLALAEEGEACAAACARLAPGDETTLELLSLYVAPAFRRRALGGTLLMELLDEVSAWTEGGVRRVTALFDPQTAGLSPLLEKAGFQLEEAAQSIAWRLSVAELAAAPLLAKPAVPPAGCALFRLEEVPDYTLRQLAQFLEQHQIADLSAAEMRQALPEVSYLLLDRAGAVRACAIVSPGPDGPVLSQFFTAGGSASAAMAVLRAAAQAMPARFPAETTVEIPTITRSSAKLMARLLPGSRAVHLTQGILML